MAGGQGIEEELNVDLANNWLTTPVSDLGAMGIIETQRSLDSFRVDSFHFLYPKYHR